MNSPYYQRRREVETKEKEAKKHEISKAEALKTVREQFDTKLSTLQEE